MKKNYNFMEVTKHFKFAGDFIEANPYGFGHINDTYAAYFRKNDNKVHRYILQRINHNVFKEPEKLMENIERVTTYLRGKVIESNGDPERETLNIIPTVDGKSFYKDEEGNYWRGYIFIEGAKTYQVVENLNHFYNAGKAFGKFQKLLRGFPAEQLHETIPNFHNTPKRFEDFMEALNNDKCNRAKDVKKEIDFVINRKEDTAVLMNLLKEGKIPLRVTHNDTKFNNVMIDDVTGEGICVIDLDTVMPGLSLYDFGDSIRSGANPAAEDEKDLSKVTIDLDLYTHFAKGFLEAVGEFLTPTEIEYLPFSAKLMTFECGIRFLTDHLNGDTYFKIHREGHNLDRARTQFKMVADMEEKHDEMMEITQKLK
ncbi:MAG TPA: aminoglycoside phosphotransferase family protein [Clostridiaceae bacterium]|nr:aminoglycoside phosphotransferase family protein [Clostridiaceae bacterium]